MSTTANQDVTVAVARAESRVLAAARAVHADVTQRQLASVTWTGPSLALARLDELMEAMGDLVAADDAEAAEIDDLEARYDAYNARRNAEHEEALDAAEALAEARGNADWHAEYEADSATIHPERNA